MRKFIYHQSFKIIQIVKLSFEVLASFPFNLIVLLNKLFIQQIILSVRFKVLMLAS